MVVVVVDVVLCVANNGGLTERTWLYNHGLSRGNHQAWKRFLCDNKGWLLVKDRGFWLLHLHLLLWKLFSSVERIYSMGT